MSTDAASQRFDVAITFAGENRAIAERIRQGLADKGLRVFYDEDFKVEMWGKNLVDFLHKVYSREAAYALMLVSHFYVEKNWTDHERQAAQERALIETREYILPVRLDDTQVPGMPSTIYYLDARVEGVQGIVNAVAEKVQSSANGASSAPLAYEGDVPATPDEFAALLSLRPPAWEYLLFAGRLREELHSHHEAYMDFQMKYTEKAGRRLDPNGGIKYIEDALSQFAHTSALVENVLSQEVQDSAFGVPGEPGDVGRISHLASRISALQLALMDTAADLRAVRVPGEHLEKAARLVADYAIQPVEAIRKLSDDLCEGLRNAPARLEAGEHIEMTMTLVFDIPDELVLEMGAELTAAKAEIASS